MPLLLLMGAAAWYVMFAYLSGRPDYSSRVSAVLSLAGTLGALALSLLALFMLLNDRQSS